MPRLRVIGVSLVLGGAVFVSPAALAAPKVLQAGQQALSLEWNPTWQVVKAPAEAPPDSVQVQAANPHDFMTVVIVEVKPPGADPEQYMRSTMGSIKQGLLAASVESDPPIEPFSGPETRGYRICATDKAPKPDEYKFICEGMASTGDLVVSFTVLYNDPGKADAAEALKAFETVRSGR